MPLRIAHREVLMDYPSVAYSPNPVAVRCVQSTGKHRSSHQHSEVNYLPRFEKGDFP